MRISDWSSDVCSSDLCPRDADHVRDVASHQAAISQSFGQPVAATLFFGIALGAQRREQRKGASLGNVQPWTNLPQAHRSGGGRQQLQGVQYPKIRQSRAPGKGGYVRLEQVDSRS